MPVTLAPKPSPLVSESTSVPGPIVPHASLLAATRVRPVDVLEAFRKGGFAAISGIDPTLITTQSLRQACKHFDNYVSETDILTVGRAVARDESERPWNASR
eukprot:1568278-Amphidinium_carterae.1